MPRVGVNPFKESEIAFRNIWHRVILPVFVPEDGGYFREMPEVLEACLTSLLNTTGDETLVTVVVNGAHRRVREVLERAAEVSERVELIWKNRNVGKVEALFGAYRASHEPYVTFSDSDVLFRPGWLERTMEIFRFFPEVGAVSALPVPHLRRLHTESTYLGAAFRRVLRVGRFAKEEDLHLYLEDLESPSLIGERLFKRQPAVVREGIAALVGCTHMQCTYRRAALSGAPTVECTAALGLNSELLWMDCPPEAAGWWKVSLPEAYVRHMGNRRPTGIPDSWRMSCGKRPVCPKEIRRPLEGYIPIRLRRILGRAIQKAVERRIQRD